MKKDMVVPDLETMNFGVVLVHCSRLYNIIPEAVAVSYNEGRALCCFSKLTNQL